MAEAPPEQVLGVQPVLEHRRRCPFRSHRDVLVQVPPDVVAEVLVAAIALPWPGHLERVVVDQRHANGADGPGGVALSADRKMPPGPQWTVCGREYPAFAASSSAVIVCASLGSRGSRFVSST